MTRQNPLDEFVLPELSEEQLKHVEATISQDAPPSDEEHEEFSEWFSLDRITSRERIKETRYTRTEKCETDNGTVVYLGSITRDRRSTKSSKVSKREIGYGLCRALAVPTVPHVFNREEGWFVTPEFEGEYNREYIFEDVERLDRFVTDLAKHAIMFNWDLGMDVLMTEDGEWRHVDITPRASKPLVAIYRLFTYSGKFLVKHGQYPPELLDIMMLRARDIGVYVCHNYEELLDEDWFSGSRYRTFTNQLPYVVEKLPITHGGHQRTDSIEHLNDVTPNGHISTLDDYWTPVGEYLTMYEERDSKKKKKEERRKAKKRREKRRRLANEFEEELENEETGGESSESSTNDGTTSSTTSDKNSDTTTESVNGDESG